MLSIDVGFGNVKVFDGEEIAAFPSVYKKTTGDYDPKTNPDAQILELDGVKYRVGMSALKLQGTSPFDKQDLFRHKIFILAGICEATESKNFSGDIALGLPIIDYKFMSNKLKKLKGYYEVKYNGKKVKIEINKISVYNQSEVVYKLLAQKNGGINDKIVGIVDIGQKTVDFTYFDGGEYSEERSGSIEYGVIDAYKSIATAVADKLGFSIPPYRARKFIDKVPEDAQEAFSTLAKEIRDNLVMYGWNFNYLDEVYFVGGGSFFAVPFFQDLPCKELDEETAVFANAYGYYEAEKG